MGADATFALLTQQLQSADDRTLSKIVNVVDRLARRGPLDRLLAEHRSRLALIRPPRPMTLGRLFVLPLEELLIDPQGWSQGSMRVPRDRLARLIALVFDALPADLAQAMHRRVAGQTMDDAALTLEVGRELWPACAAAVRRTLERGRQSRDAEIRDLLVPLRIAEHLLPVAEAVVTTVWALPPKPMLELDEAAREKLADLLGRAAAVGKDCFQLVAELLVNRSELPLSIIEPVLGGAFEWGNRERQQAAAMIAEACQSDMVRLYQRLAATPPDAELRQLAPALQTVVSNLESLQDAAATVKFDHRALRRLKLDTFALIETRLTQALQQQLRAAFEALDDQADVQEWRRLEANAAAAANLRLMAKRIGLASKIDFLFTKAFERYRDSLLAACGSGPAAAGGLPTALTAPAMDRLRLIELVFGSAAAMQVLQQLRQATP